MGQGQSALTDQGEVEDREEVLQAVNYATREVDVRSNFGSLNIL